MNDPPARIHFIPDLFTLFHPIQIEIEHFTHQETLHEIPGFS